MTRVTLRSLLLLVVTLCFQCLVIRAEIDFERERFLRDHADRVRDAVDKLKSAGASASAMKEEFQGAASGLKESLARRTKLDNPSEQLREKLREVSERISNLKVDEL